MAACPGQACAGLPGSYARDLKISVKAQATFVSCAVNCMCYLPESRNTSKIHQEQALKLNNTG